MTKREKTLLYIAIIIAIIAIYTTVVLPYVDKTTVILNETETLQAEIDMENVKIGAIETIKEKVFENQAELDELKNSYGETKTQEQIATYFTNLGEQNGLEVTAFSQTRTNELLEERELELFNMAEVTLTCKGDYGNYISMVDVLNQREDIVVLSLTSNEDEETLSCIVKCLLLMNK